MFFVCLFPTNARNFRQKIPTFLKKWRKEGGKQTNSEKNLEKRQNENFYLAYFSKRNRDQIEKKVIPFWRPPLWPHGVWRGGGIIGVKKLIELVEIPLSIFPHLQILVHLNTFFLS